MQKALFIDRDGVINVDRGHVYSQEDFEFNDGIFDLCKGYSDSGYLILIITNQAGIAKGIFTEAEFIKLTEWMISRFQEKGILISKVYYCPHHPDFTGPCKCRKPQPGMLLNAIKEFDLDITECVLIGDMETDLEAGRRAGIPEANLQLYIF